MPYLPLGQMSVQTDERSVVTSVENRHENAAQPLTNATRLAADSEVTEEVDQQVAKPKSTAEASEEKLLYRTIFSAGIYSIGYTYTCVGDIAKHGVTENPAETHTVGVY